MEHDRTVYKGSVDVLNWERSASGMLYIYVHLGTDEYMCMYNDL